MIFCRWYDVEELCFDYTFFIFAKLGVWVIPSWLSCLKSGGMSQVRNIHRYKELNLYCDDYSATRCISWKTSLPEEGRAEGEDKNMCFPTDMYKNNLKRISIRSQGPHDFKCIQPVSSLFVAVESWFVQAQAQAGMWASKSLRNQKCVSLLAPWKKVFFQQLFVVKFITI